MTTSVDNGGGPERDLNAIYVCGPGHGGPGMVANAYLEGTYSERYTGIGQDVDGLRRLFKQFSFPGGIPSHAAPETPGSINEGGDLGYSPAHAYGAAFDNPDLLVACVVGDGEAESGPLAASWHSNKFLDPATDGAVLPILHLNGYKIANPTVLARISRRELECLFERYGYEPFVDLMRFQPPEEQPHGLSDSDFDALFTTDRRSSSPTTCASTWGPPGRRSAGPTWSPSPAGLAKTRRPRGPIFSPRSPGWQLDPDANRVGPAERRISRPGPHAEIWVIPTREMLTIARELEVLLDGSANAEACR